MLIYLVGLPGSGKSTIGKQLAEMMKYKFHDLDEAICQLENTTIDKIFEKKGENYFRLLEREELEKTFEMKDTIISTGGGVPCYFDNMTQMNKYGVTIFINPSLDELSTRIIGQGSENRPMFKNKSMKQILEFLELKTKERKPFYEQSRYIFNSNRLTAKEVFKKVSIE
jgi:shikimate kinase